MKLLFSIALLFGASFFYGQNSNPFNIPSKVNDEQSVHYENFSTQEIRDANDQVFQTSDSIIGAQKEVPLTLNPFDKGTRKVMSTSLILKSERSIRDLETPLSNQILQKDTKVVVLVYSLFMLVILTLAISMDRGRFNSMMKSSINSNYLRTLYRDTNAWTNGQNLILYMIFILNGSFVIWLLMIKQNGPWAINLLMIALAIVACYAVRHLVLLIISVTFSLGSEVGLHNFSIGLHNMVLGILLLPAIMAIEFMPGINQKTFLLVVGMIFLIIYALRQVKGLLTCIGMRSFNPFYFFVYLCAIEIAPVLVGYKIMIGAL